MQIMVTVEQLKHCITLPEKLAGSLDICFNNKHP